MEGLVDTCRGDCASSANRVSPATLDEHEGATLHEHQYVGMPSPSWPTRATVATFQMSSRVCVGMRSASHSGSDNAQTNSGGLAIPLGGYAITAPKTCRC